MRSLVMIGRWFTPTTSKSKLRKSTSRICESVNCAPVISWQRPTVFTDVSRVTARHSVVIGFVMLSIHASGQISSMSRAIATSTGMLRSARMTPPGPDGVADRLLDAVALGDLEIVAHALERAGGDAHHHVVGALERLAPIGGGRHGDAGALQAVDVPDEVGHRGQRLGVDVLEHQLGLGERRRVHDVEEQLRDPLEARTTDDHDPRRHRPSRSSAAPET